MKKSHLLFGLMLLGLVLSLEFAVSALAGVSSEVLEKERLARYNINYASYLIDVGKYMDALECYETAAEVTTIPKTKAEALLAKATLLSSFLDAPEEALRVYQEVGKVYKPAAEVAEYRQGLLLFSMRRFDAAKKTLEHYQRAFPKGKFRFQAEALLGEIARMPRPAPPTPTPQPPPPTPQPPTPTPKPPTPTPQPPTPTPKPPTPTPQPSPPTPLPPAPHVVKRKAPEVRVRVCEATEEAKIMGGSVCASGFGCRDRFSLRVKRGKLLINQSQTADGAVTFSSDKPLKIVCGKKVKRLRGRLVASVRGGKLLVINVLSIEDYLLSVVPSENPASWPIESLKAQAVAARTYAYYQLLHRRNWAYDLVDYAGDQAYDGMHVENPRSTKAVRATSGEILTYKGKPILAMFSANSGGYTADSDAIFDLYKPYLVARPDPASLKGRMADWTRQFTVSHVVAALNRISVDADGLKSIKVDERGPSGRIVKVRLVLQDGKSMVLRNRTTLRRALNLPEILYGLEREGNTFIFKGHGWGHGVGYSQWGSAYLGKKENYKKILSFYYERAKLEKLWR